MNWTKQTEEMMKEWADTQKQMWENWLKAVQGAGGTAQLDELWQKTVETWEGNVQKTMAAQAEWTETWFSELNAQTGVPEPVVKWAQQGQTMNKRWQDTQMRLWQGWFDFLRKANPVKLNETFQAEGQKTFESWQTTAQKMMNAQMEFVKLWMPGGKQ